MIGMIDVIFHKYGQKNIFSAMIFFSFHHSFVILGGGRHSLCDIRNVGVFAASILVWEVIAVL